MDSSEFQCIICNLECNDTDREPMKVCEQQHWVCHICLLQIKQKSSQCPLCHTPLPKNVKKFRTLMNLKIKWDKSKLGDNVSKSEFKEVKQQLEEEKAKIIYRSEVKVQQSKWQTPQKVVDNTSEKIQLKQKILSEQHKEEIKHEKKQSQSQILKCSKNHPLTKTKSLPTQYPKNRYGCNGCGVAKVASLNNQVWHCSKCNYDLCKQCSSNQNRSKLQCDAKHKLFKTAVLGLPYVVNRFVCNSCRHLKSASLSNPVWHCHVCRYDLCKQCTSKI